MDPEDNIILFPILLRLAPFLTYSIVASADNKKETKSTILSTLNNPMHVYISLGKHPVINIHKNTANIDISKASVIKKGKDILLFTIGKNV
ncbi:hypothetical protein MCU_00889 [Bartonella elizabethae Re6043vi]|uniref:Uncharacterized protein n=2 Tax=Bartonella elizabethae TaxID=807 RepID=J0RCS6_BAREL|nr:hypothetical protein [Bartonella elizabethae]EJF84221.1 hypothetical protein MCU_00889 [Bartonella elizabethae Re6043vi]EJF96536.1 hypothetical protein MEE_00435 [Bartonella elizabethae F9251 = ATCC 49927]VEJ39788.1 Uncharacterised protein [Bartonella elizabethae]